MRFLLGFLRWLVLINAIGLTFSRLILIRRCLRAGSGPSSYLLISALIELLALAGVLIAGLAWFHLLWLYLLALILGFLGNIPNSILGTIGHAFGSLLNIGVDRERAVRIGTLVRSARQTYFELANAGMSPEQISEPFRTEVSMLLQQLPAEDHLDFRYGLERELQFVQRIIAVSRTRKREAPM